MIPYSKQLKDNSLFYDGCRDVMRETMEMDLSELRVYGVNDCRPGREENSEKFGFNKNGKTIFIPRAWMGVDSMNMVVIDDSRVGVVRFLVIKRGAYHERFNLEIYPVFIDRHVTTENSTAQQRTDTKDTLHRVR